MLSVLTLQAGWNSAVVVIGTTLLGLAAGAIGAFLVLRRRSLMGDALAHCALPGLGIAFILGSLLGIGGRQLWLLLAGAAISGVIGVLCVQFISRFSRLHEDTAIGAVLSCFFGAGVVLMSVIQNLGTGEEGGLHSFIFGQTAAMTRLDAQLTLIVAAAAALACLFLFKELRLICFDEQFAEAQGWPVTLIDLAMMAIVVVVTVIGLQSVGLLLVIALLVIPAAGARFWTDSLRAMVVGSALIGSLSGYLGSAVSSLLPRLPAGAVIVLVAGGIFIFSFLFAPKRGFFAALISKARLNLRITEDHLLREVYELYETSQDEIHSKFIELSKVRLMSDYSSFNRCVLLWLLKNLVEVRGSEIRLTEAGLEAAASRVRNHRLWEEYLLTYAEVPASHVDYSADLVEHVLSPEIVESLEEKLALRVDTLKSPHPL